MKIRLNDSTEMTVHTVEKEESRLKIKILSADRDTLRNIFGDPFKTKKIEAGETFSGYTELEYIAEYTGGIWEVSLLKADSAESESVLAAAVALAKIQAQSADDETAVKIAALYPEWETGKEYAEGTRLQYGGGLFKVRQAHTSQADWDPEAATSLFARIDETHAGTETDAIPYAPGMELEEGKIYTQLGASYLCTRSSGAPVYHALTDLIGLYVERVEE